MTIGAHTDVLELRVVSGQSINDWQKQADALAAAWRADRLTIRATTPGALRVTVMRGDVLAQPIGLPMPTPATPVDLAAVRVGVTETRAWWRVPLLGHHLLVAGATGAGKGSVLWSLIAGIAPAVRSGVVRLCVIDPKGGMELGRGSTDVQLLHPRSHRHHDRAATSTGAADARRGRTGCAGAPACTPPLRPSP